MVVVHGQPRAGELALAGRAAVAQVLVRVELRGGVAGAGVGLAQQVAGVPQLGRRSPVAVVGAGGTIILLDAGLGGFDGG